MTRIKLLAISAITTVMILGSSIVIAMTPVEQGSEQVAADAAGASVLEQAKPGPVTRRGGGGAGMHLRK